MISELESMVDECIVCILSASRSYAYIQMHFMEIYFLSFIHLAIPDLIFVLHPVNVENL
jgi:hypothetical protein